MIRPFALLVAAWTAIVLSAVPVAAGPVYLALGDSSAFGETDRTRNPSNGDRGYVAPFADYLGQKNGGVRPTVLNLGINGETTGSYSTGIGRVSSDGIYLNSNYAGYAPTYPSQRAEFLKQVEVVKARGDRIDTVTVQFGANDLDALATSPGFLTLSPGEQQALVFQRIMAARSNYVDVLADVRGALPDADVYLIGYHNPFPGQPEHPLAPLSAPALQGLNGVVADLAPQYDAKYVDFYHVVLGREAELTLITTNDPVNNVHLNDAGYAAVSAELIRVAAATPEPCTFVLLGIAGLSAVASRRAKRRKVAA